ncbi:helix-turn-helix domain-containing protein [Nocardia sp. NPDC058518]|uniref:helix-turn-helix domain-containing protein n=1 Tax=Nocardia sp. NPDC058518 TaxID=3346534 RepID=UPI003669EFB3
MPQRADVAEFLRSRRGRITPDKAGILGGGRRRVAGLRREEVAALAGVSVDYYARIERGDISGVSPEVIDSIALALRLDAAETAHLHDLARARKTFGRPGPHDATTVPAGLRRFLDVATGAAVWVRDRQLDFVAANALGRALYGPVLTDPISRANVARFTFLSPESRSFFPDWEEGADGIVATLRTYSGQSPDHGGLAELIDELDAHSAEFRARWREHNVRFHRSGAKRINHPQVGDLELSYEPMILPDHPDWFMFALVPAQPGSPTEERLRQLEHDAARSA